jgi:hypothetical protein
MMDATTAFAKTVKASFFGLAALIPAAALAQYGGSSTSSPPPDVPSSRSSSHAQNGPATPSAPADVWRAAACLAGQNAAPGNALLATVPRSTPEHDQVVAMLRAAPRCTHSSAPVITGVMTMRAAVAEGLYETQFATPVAARSPALGATPLPRPTVGDPAYLAAIATMSGLVDCATPRRPDLVRAILATDPGTPAESTAVLALTETYRTCVPAGTQLSIDPKLMRFLFAEALYRWSVVQRDGPASPWAAAAAAVPAATRAH